MKIARVALLFVAVFSLPLVASQSNNTAQPQSKKEEKWDQSDINMSSTATNGYLAILCGCCSAKKAAKTHAQRVAESRKTSPTKKHVQINIDGHKK